MNMPFEQPGLLFLIIPGLFAVWKLVRQQNAIGFSSSELFSGVRLGWSFRTVERVFLSVFVIAGTLILARPIQIEKISVPVYKEARDITIVLDTSGSMMGEEIKVASAVVSDFADGRPNDRIALVVFDTSAYLEWPLSPDHSPLTYRLNHIVPDGGTEIARGVIAGLMHQKQFGKNPGAVIVVSDGSSDVTSEEISSMKDNLGQTKLYFVQIGKPDYLARNVWDIVKKLGGTVYSGEISDLGSIFSEISNLETSPVVWEQHIQSTYQFGILPIVALLSFLGAGLIETMREV